MATFTLAANQKWDDAAFSTRAGKDTYNLGAYTLTVDTDTRYCANATAITGNFGALNINTGKLLVDGTAVRLIPYNSGSGNVPAYGTSISQGGVSGPLLGVWSAINTAPTAAGAAMPASGYIKVRSVTGGAFAAGALTGIGASATGADVAGWIELAGCEGTSIAFDSGNTAYLGSVVMNGAWFAVGTTPATPATTDTYQLPASEGVAYYAGVEVETGNGTGVYEWWPAVNGLSKNQYATDERGMVCWIDSAGVLRFGDDGLGVAVTAWVTATSYAIGNQRENGGTVYFCLVAHTSGTFATDLAAGRWASGSVGGKLPAANARIRVGNILLSQAASSSPYANVAPSATLTTRYRVSTGNAKTLMDKVSCGWRMIVGGGDSIEVTDTNMLEQFIIGAACNSISVDGLCIGLSGAAIAANDSQFNLNGCFCAPSINNLVVTKKVEANTGPFYLNTPYGGSFSKIKVINACNRTSSNNYTIYTDTMENVSFNDITVIGGGINAAGTRCNWTNVKYSDTLCGPVQAANSTCVFASAGYDVVIDGVSWAGTTANTCHPYLAIISLDRRFRTKLRNIGSYAAPLNAGTVNQMAAIISAAGSQLAKIAKIDRCYTTAVRTGIMTSGSIAGHGVNWQLSDCSVASGAQAVYASYNGFNRNCMGANALTYIPGNHISALYQSATAGTLNFRCSTPLTEEPSLSTLTASSGVIFTAATAYMPAVDDRITFKCPFKVRGYTAFSGAATFNSGTIGNFLVEYSLDLGATWKTASSGNLTGETLPDPAVGFDFWCRATTVTPGNTTANGIGCIVFPMTTSAAAQANQYALEEITFTDSGVLSGSSVAWIDPAGTTVFGFYTGSGGEAIYQNQDGTEKTGSYKVRKAGYAEASGVWVETSSWYLETKTYFVSQALKEATIADSGGITFVGDTSATLGASKTLQQLYSNAQHWSCLEANMLYAIPVVSAGGGAYSANVDVVTTGYTLNGSGSLTMGSKTLTATGYTYTGGTFSQASTTPSFSGGTLTLPTKITSSADFSITGATIEFGAAGADWNLSDATFSGTITLATTAGQSVTVAMPTGVTVNNTEPGNITVTTPILSADIEWAGALDGTTVLLYNDSDAGALIDTQTVSGAGGYSWSITLPHADVAVGDTLRLRFGNKAYYADELQGTMTASGLTFVGSMTLHPVYAAWALDGADYDQANGGPYTMDGANLQVDIDSGSTTGLKTQLGAWTQYLMTLPAGLDAFYGAWDLLAINQIRQNVAVVDVKIDVPTAGALFEYTDNDVNYYRSDFTFPGNVQAGHGLVAMTYNASIFVPDPVIVSGESVVTGTPDTVADAVRVELATELAATVEVWRRHGLDIAAPLTQTSTAITAGTIDLAITGDPDVSVTVTRQP